MKPVSLLLTVALMGLSLTACTGDTVPETTFDESSLASDETNEDTTAPGLSPDAGLQERLQAQLSPTNQMPTTTFRENFYSISSLLITPLEQSGVFDRDKLADWETYANTQETDDPYLYNNLYYFLRFFEIPRETLESLYYSTDLYYHYDLDLELLYGDDIEAVYAYYRTDNEEFAKRHAEYTLKDRMREYVGEDTFNAWSEEAHHSTDILTWSIPEAIYAFEIPREDMETLIAGETDEIEPVVEEVYEDGSTAILSGTPAYTYDLDLIYSVTSVDRLLAALDMVQTDTLTGYQVDMLIRE